ncbi:MAG: Peptidase S8 and S53, subtilisin, kexin, sedolisin [uncultured Chloroflexia bacterium]|uniref:Peptidase S8 and S53, subtilisin, kexin, sedolisin n=1 Tax=uncultured Chloroflexia bacterium TaxID=1672391 RepID=A0A6J4LZJ6_9CHLR|nr:MAG: Peptidase S8 and S53, subtilisin, kexin, sedolisin [uncultured Chloroflexia bacterium]
MRHRITRLFGPVVFVVLALSLAMPINSALGQGTARSNPQSDAPQTGPQVDQQYAVVQLKGDPLTTSAKTRPAPGKKVDFNNSAVKAYRAQLMALRNDFKSWLRANAPKAKVTGEFDLALNAVAVKLNGERLATIAAAPQAQRAEYQGLYYPTDTDPDLAIISAKQAWARAGGAANAGTGIKVAVVDSGIDVTHPCFSDAGYPDQQESGDLRFTNDKVIVAKVFNNKAGSRGYTAEAIDSHGTHVAGTIACNFETPAEVDGADIPYGVSGVAPRALLGNYNVFPGDVASARSEDILNALEAAYADDFDVANMSLGGGSSGIQDLLSMGVDNLDQGNMVVAVSAGNSGPGHYTVGSPGIAPRALTAGASTVPHFVGSPVVVGGKTYGGATGDFATVTTDFTAPLAVVPGGTNGLDTACAALTADLTGKIALISRGVCSFSTKIRNAENAGAAAVLVSNNVAGDPTAMASDGTADQPTVPAYMVALSTGKALLGSTASTTIGAALEYIATPNVDIMAGFSSQGPTDVDFRIKPDVVAPGVNVLSSVPGDCGDGGCWAFYQGTSMAAPHLAGAAAVVRQQHPDWSAAQVRSTIVNTADDDVLTAYTDGTTPVTDVNIQGAGRLNLLSAVRAGVALDPVSVSFGAVPSGSSQTRTFDVTLTNTGGANDFALSMDAGDASVTYSVSPSSVSLERGQSASVQVTMLVRDGASKGDHQGWLKISSGGAEIAHAAVYTLLK